MARVLVIDDNPLLRATLDDGLRHHGHEVFLAKNGFEAIALLKSAAPDVLVCDVLMPDKDGFEVLREVRALSPNLPVIIMSGGGLVPQETLLSYARDFGAAATLAKPVRLADLNNAIADALKARDTSSPV
jgi:CheY-like chemotaxis protein